VTQTTQNWVVDGESVKVVVSRPDSSGRSADPVLVVYLPGLGESASAGRAWQIAWASAGYAVMSVQLLADDANAWSSDLARAGEFKALGQRHFSASESARRIQRLNRLLAEVHRRADDGDPAWSGMDAQRIAVAGYDLGADTASAWASGANPAIAGDQQPAIAAVIALDPRRTADGGGGGPSPPRLSISSASDPDPLGGADPARRRSAFDRGPAGAQYWLAMSQLPHAALSGSARGPQPEDFAAKAPNGGGRSGGTDGEGGSRSGGGRHKGGGGGSADAGRADRGARGADPAAGEGEYRRQSLAAQGQALAAARIVSTAFLDAHLRGDANARSWLAANAATWLVGSADWLIK
jgi:uncharacterized membrane protein YgcG